MTVRFARPRANAALRIWLLVLVIIGLGCAAGPLTLGLDPLRQDLDATLQGPSSAHWLGTDYLGRDLLARLMDGGLYTLRGVALALTVFTALGVPLGLLVGYLGGWPDRIVEGLCNLLYSTPAIVLVLAVLAVFGGGMVPAMITLGILGAPGMIRVLRSSTQAVRNELYVRAARATGLSDFDVVRLHVLPRLAGPVLVQTSLFAAGAILTETGLGYLGFGARTPDPSWGNLIADASQNVERHPWMLVPTGCTVFVTILALGLVGDGLRDAHAERWSPRTRPPRRAIQPTARPNQKAAAAVAPASNMLEIAGLTVSFPGLDGEFRPVIHDVGLQVATNERVCIVGESGCGKSVLALAILGTQRGSGRIDTGSVHFDGHDLLAMSPSQLRSIRGDRIAFVSQEAIGALDPSMRVKEHFLAVLRAHQDITKTEAQALAIRLLLDVRIKDAEEVAERYPRELSGGMAQRVGIALALANEPDLLIADEPTTALDVTVQAEILDLLRDLRKTRQLAVVVVTHDFGVVADFADRAVVMYAGQVVEVGTPQQLHDQPAHPYTRSLQRANPAEGTPRTPLSALAGSVPSPDAWPTGCHFADRCPLAIAPCREAPIPLAMHDARLARCVRSSELLAGAEVGTSLQASAADGARHD